MLHAQDLLDSVGGTSRLTSETACSQLSTRTKDYVIDALEPAVRDNLDSLNEFFTDPEWVKVRTV